MDDVGTALRAAGLKRTPARVRVLGAIEAVGAPVSHAELAAHADVEGVDPIMLYRTLATLEEARLVHRVHGVDGAWRYCAQPRGVSGCPGNHPHFLCTGCGAMSCLLDHDVPRVEVPAGAVVEARHLLAWGRCAVCASAS